MSSFVWSLFQNPKIFSWLNIKKKFKKKRKMLCLLSDQFQIYFPVDPHFTVALFPVPFHMFHPCFPASAKFHAVVWGGGNNNEQPSSWLLVLRDMRARLLHYTEGLYNYILIHSCFWPDKRILSISFCLIHTIINQMCPCPPPTPPSPPPGFWGSAADRLGVPRGG